MRNHNVAWVTWFKEHFWDNVDKSSDCWIWKGPTQGTYGKTALGLAHRVAWSLTHNEELTRKDLILHSCNNPPCCNPDHLRKGTQSDNMKQMHAEGRWHITQQGDISRKMSASFTHKGVPKSDETKAKMSIAIKQHEALYGHRKMSDSEREKHRRIARERWSKGPEAWGRKPNNPERK